MSAFEQGPVLQCAGRSLDLSAPQIMAVLNTTPDSFSDGGSLYRKQRLNLELAIARARAMVAAGANILDIGGESTRPGALPIAGDEEMERVLPLVEKIAGELDVIISVDTSNPQLMSAAAAAGAGMINDVRALERAGAMEAAAESGLPLCLMHMQGSPVHMQDNPQYVDVVEQVKSYLQQRVSACEEAGIARQRLLIDPGFGFGKTLAHNLQLLQRLHELQDLDLPILVGLSRKSLLASLLGREVDQRLAGSLALAVLAAERGASIIRTHDVTETADAVAVATAVTRGMD